jgi:hypothetical protein
MEEIKPFEYNKFKYTEQGIEYPDDIKFPSHLFKYYPINSKSLDAFVNGYLFFSHPNQLNDILDCSIFLFNPESCTKKLYDGIWKHYIRELNWNIELILDYEIAKKDKFRELVLIIDYWKFFHRGILSLTTNPYNKLMMSHYTSEKGFVLEFNPDKLLNFLEQEYLKENVNLYPINYVKNLKPINYFENVIDELSIDEDNYLVHKLKDKIPTLYIASLKDDVWVYEDEWRILLKKNNMGFAKHSTQFNKVDPSHIRTNDRKINYNFDCLEKIILAPMFFNNYYFEEIKIDSNDTKVSYKLNEVNLENEKIKEIYEKFLEKICSESMDGKIFIQDVKFGKEGYDRICYKLTNIELFVGVISFNVLPEIYRFGVKEI